MATEYRSGNAYLSAVFKWADLKGCPISLEVMNKGIMLGKALNHGGRFSLVASWF